MIISSYKVVQRIEELKRQIRYDMERRENLDGDHCYKSALNAYMMAIQMVHAESFEQRKHFPVRTLPQIRDVKKRCMSALRALDLSDFKRCRLTIERILKMPDAFVYEIDEMEKRPK